MRRRELMGEEREDWWNDPKYDGFNFIGEFPPGTDPSDCYWVDTNVTSGIGNEYYLTIDAKGRFASNIDEIRYTRLPLELCCYVFSPKMLAIHRFPNFNKDLSVGSNVNDFSSLFRVFWPETPALRSINLDAITGNGCCSDEYDSGYNAVKYMANWFAYYYELEYLNLCNFRGKYVTEMSGFCAHCSKLKFVDLSSFEPEDTIGIRQSSLFYDHGELRIRCKKSTAELLRYAMDHTYNLEGITFETID